MDEQINGVRTWIEIDRSALRHNLSVFRSIIPESCKICAVVKSNAYGHGLVDFARSAEQAGADWLVVDSITEALRLRKEGIKAPVLVLGFTLPEMLESARENDISITVSHSYILDLLSKMPAGKPFKVHIKADTGMNRQGFSEKEMPEAIKLLSAKPSNIIVEGLYTHYAAAKDPSNPAPTKKQTEVFGRWIEALQAIGISPIKHAAASGAAILFPETHFDMVRIGIGLYGLWPSLESKGFVDGKFELKPCLSWRTIVSEVNDVPAGSGVSYDFTETVTRDSKLAVCPIGYWHGFPRALSSIGHVLVRGKRAKVIGRVCMDMIIVDVTDIPDVSVLDRVTVIGKDGEEEITAEEIAVSMGASWYELITRINPLIRKVYLN